MDEITEALSMLQLVLLDIVLDDRDEPYTPEERYEVLIGVMRRISELVEDVGGGTALDRAYRRFRLRLLMREELGL